MISSKYWHTRFGSDPGAVGKTIKINNVPVTIVGVLPPEFTGMQQPVGEPPDISVAARARAAADTPAREPPG